MVAAILIFSAFLLFLSLFAFPKLSPIPYFPSNAKDMDMILDFISLKNGQTVIDLGAGDGIVIFRAASLALAKGTDTKFIAVDINPVLVFIMHIRRFFHKNKKNILILRADMFDKNFKFIIQNSKLFKNWKLDFGNWIFYLYISPWLLEKTLKIIKSGPGKKSIVSYYYPIKSLKPERAGEGMHKIFRYRC